MTENGNSFSERIKNLIKTIPPGKVAAYGQIATMAGNPHEAIFCLREALQSRRSP